MLSKVHLCSQMHVVLKSIIPPVQRPMIHQHILSKVKSLMKICDDPVISAARSPLSYFRKRSFNSRAVILSFPFLSEASGLSCNLEPLWRDGDFSCHLQTPSPTADIYGTPAALSPACCMEAQGRK